MKRFIPLLALFGAGVAASFALASPPPGHHDQTSSTSTSEHGKSGDHPNKCHPVNLKGTVSGGTIALKVTKGSGHANQLQGTTANLTVNGQVSVQAWACAAAGSNATQTLFLRQLHVGGKPQSGVTITTSSP